MFKNFENNQKISSLIRILKFTPLPVGEARKYINETCCRHSRHFMFSIKNEMTLHKFRIQSESLYSHQPIPPFATFLFLDFDNLLSGFVFFGLRDYVIRLRVNRSKWLVNPSFNNVINAFAEFCFPINNSVMSRLSVKAQCSYVRRQHYVMLLQDIDCVYSVDSSKEAINQILSRLEWPNIIKRDRIKNTYISYLCHSTLLSLRAFHALS